MVEGAPMRFPGGTFSRYAVLSLGWGGRYTRERTEHWTHARARTPASRSAHGIFHVPVFSILRRFMGRFFRGHGSGCPGTEQGCAPFLAAPAIQEGRFSFASGRRTSFRSISREAVLKCSSAEAAPWLHVTVAVSGTPPAISKVPLPSPSEW